LDVALRLAEKLALRVLGLFADVEVRDGAVISHHAGVDLARLAFVVV
jgi:hypothetical protein